MRKPKQPSSLRCLRIFWLIPCILLLACMGCNSIGQYGMDVPRPPGAATNSTDAIDDCGYTELHKVAAIGLVKVVKRLLAQGANPNAKDLQGCNPLHHAARYNHSKVVKRLLKKGADLNAKDKAGWTPLHHAAAYGSIKVVRRLVTAGADLNAQDNEGKTPIHHAATYGHEAVVQALLQAGAQPHNTDPNGKQPDDLAIQGGQKNTTTLTNRHPEEQAGLGAVSRARGWVARLVSGAHRPEGFTRLH